MLDAGVLELDRTSLGFGTEFGSGTWLGTAPQQSLLIRNGGLQTLTVSDAILGGADATAFSLGQTAGISLNSGEQKFLHGLARGQALAFSSGG